MSHTTQDFRANLRGEQNSAVERLVFGSSKVANLEFELLRTVQAPASNVFFTKRWIGSKFLEEIKIVK